MAEHEDCGEFAYRAPWSWAVAAGVGGGVAMGPGIGRALGGYPLAPQMAGTLSAVALIGLGLALWGVAAWMIVARLRHRRHVGVTNGEISFPMSRWSTRVEVVPWESITALRTACVRGRKQLELVWPEGEVVIGSSMLGGAEAFDRLLGLVSGRLAELGVAVEDRTSVEEARRLRPQFTIAWMLVAMMFVAAVLGTYSFVYGTYSWDVLLHVVLTLGVLLAVPWLMTTAPVGAKVFALGFVIGAWVEWVAVFTFLSLGWLQVPPGRPTDTWYPMTALLWRVGAVFGWSNWLSAGISGYLLGAALSGAVVGVLALAIRRVVARRWRLAGAGS